ncbi:MAG: hypothetical protein C0606_12045 [Hyphomicrobiales bacterium]|nr:MAG: hypothetical protein C0606_12045 [Hyphomicrobiales bacterium]
MIPTFLLIDDDTCMHRLLDAFLQRRFSSGYQLISAHDLNDGIEWLKSAAAAYDAIFLDSRLPPFRDATETLPLVKDAAPDARVFVISADTGDDAFAENIGPMADGFLDKFALGDEIRNGLVG